MLRAVAILSVSAALAATAAYGAPAPSGTRIAAVPTEITLRARVDTGPWKKTLSLKLRKMQVTNFSLCGIWNRPTGAKLDCRATPRHRLPAGTSLRLEQNPVASAVRRVGSPGWGMLGVSATPSLGAALSNLVAGNRYGKFTYRVTLRSRTGHVVARSNALTVIWRR